MLTKGQIQLAQIARRKAGLTEGRYRMLLRKYKQSDGDAVTSCTQLNHWQLEDFLAICESMGWQHPKHGANYYQKHIRSCGNSLMHAASFSSRQAIELLAGDLGWNTENLKPFIRRMTGETYETVSDLSDHYAWQIIEALKAMLSRKDGVKYETLADVKSAYSTEAATDGETNQKTG